MFCKIRLVEQLLIPFCIAPTPLGPLVEILEFNLENSCLQGIQAAIDTHRLVKISHAATMDAQHGQRIGQRLIVRGNQPPVTEATEVFGREKAETADIPEDTGALPLLRCSDCLAGILDHADLSSGRNFFNGSHSGALAEQMHGDNGLRSRSNRLLDLVGIYIEARASRSSMLSSDSVSYSLSPMLAV